MPRTTPPKDDTNTNTGTSTGSNTGTGTEPPTGVNSEIKEATTYKKDVIVGTSYAFTMLDPHGTYNVNHNTQNVMVYDTLIFWDSTEKVFKPELATEWKWTDDVTLNVKLRDDVYFHDGGKMTAEDVEFSFKRCIEMGSSGASMMKMIEKCEIVNDYEINFTLNEVNVDFLAYLSVPYASIISKAAMEKDPTNGQHIGTGAWIYVDMVEGDYMKLKRNDNYWGELPKSETMTIKTIPENSTRLIALQNNEIDLCMSPSATELGIIEKDKNLKLYSFDRTTLSYLAFNSQLGPGADQNFRLAVAHAVDIEELALVYCDGQANLASVFWGWTTYGYDSTIERYEYNLDKAKEYLEKTPYRTLELTCTSGYKTVAETIQAQLKDIGIEVKVNEVQGAAQTAMTKYADATHQAMVYGLSWNDMGDDARRPYYKDSNTNKAIIHDQEIFDWIDDAKKEFDDTKRKELYSNVQQKNHDQCYFLPLFYPYKYVVLPDNGGGVRLEPNTYHDWTYYCVAEK